MPNGIDGNNVAIMTIRKYKKLLLCIFLLIPALGYDVNSEELNVSDALLSYKADELIKEQRYYEAIQIYNNLIIKYPDEPSLYDKLATTKVLFVGLSHDASAQKNPVTIEALDDLKNAMMLAPDVLEYKIKYALLASDLKYCGKAIEVYDELFSNNSIRVHEKYRYAIIDYAICLSQEGKVDISLNELKKSINANDYDQRFVISYIDMLAISGNFNELKEFYDVYLKEKGYSQEVHQVLCLVSMAMKKFEYSLSCFESFLKNDLATDRVLISRARKSIKYIKNQIAKE